MAKRLFAEKVDLRSWRALCTFVSKHAHVQQSGTSARWIFRGLSDYGHDKGEITSSFDREIHAARIRGRIGRLSYERQILYDFKRRAHHYLGGDAIPKAEDFLEWFGLMRHWGVPSRLVDFSYSFFVATYFAISGARTDAAVVCVDLTWLVGLTNESVQEGDYFQKPATFWKHAVKPERGRKGMVVPVRPFRSNDRVHAQQGLFLCPTDITRTFDENLREMVDSQEAKKRIIKLKIRKSLHRQILAELRAMNISYETLYPGLEGFAKCMKDAFALPLRPLDKDLSDELLSERPTF
jgi:hypothetical protein